MVFLNSLTTGIVDLGLFPTDIFSEIKLNSGGNSTLSGSGAIAGSIQLNNTLDFNPSYKWEIDLTKGSYGLEKQSFSYTLGDKKFFTDSVFRLYNQNDFEYINIGLPNSPLEVQEYASKSAKQYILNYGYQNEKIR